MSVNREANQSSSLQIERTSSARSRLRTTGAGDRTFSLVRSLPEQIAERIAEEIIEDRFPPGTRLKEVELARSFGVSRAPIREALRLLETQKLVRIVPQRGAVVTTLSIAELDELFEIRAALMGLSVRKLAERGSDADHAALATRVADVERLMTAGDKTAFVRGLGRLSVEAAELAGPGWIRDFLVISIHQTVKFSRRGLASETSGRQLMTGWKRLLGAVRARKPDVAEAHARKLMLTAWSLARPVLEALHSDGDR